MIPHQVETQYIASQPYPVSDSGPIPSLSAAPVPCWYRKCQYQAMVTQTVPTSTRLPDAALQDPATDLASLGLVYLILVSHYTRSEPLVLNGAFQTFE